MANLEEIHAEVVALRAVVLELRDAQATAARPVLSQAEAMQLVGVRSVSAFQRWAAAWKVKSAGKGRWARRALLAGLEREAGAVTKRRWTPEKAKAAA